LAYREFHHYLNDFQLRPNARRWWPKALAICAFLGGVYGASLGSAVGALPGAANVIEIAVVVMAVILVVPGTRIGSLIGALNRMRFGRLFLGMFAAIGGAIVGGFVATMILLAFGAILGAVGGWVLMRHFFLRRIFGGIVGAVLGMFIGAILWAVNLNPAAALIRAAWGFGIGAIVGLLLLLMVVGALNGLAVALLRRSLSLLTLLLFLDRQLRLIVRGPFLLVFVRHRIPLWFLIRVPCH